MKYSHDTLLGKVTEKPCEPCEPFRKAAKSRTPWPRLSDIVAALRETLDRDHSALSRCEVARSRHSFGTIALAVIVRDTRFVSVRSLARVS